MKLTKSNDKVTILQHGDFRICIIEKEDEFDAWLAFRQNGIATFMFGILKNQSNGSTVDFHEFCELIQNNLEEYEWLYLQEMKDVERED